MSRSSISNALNTPDLVAESGFKYFCDFYHDDQPVPVQVRSGRVISLLYQTELNDSILYARGAEGVDFLNIARDMFDTLYAEGEQNPRVMTPAFHPFITGRPHRVRYLQEALEYILGHDKVWFSTGEEIANWYYDSGHCDRLLPSAGQSQSWDSLLNAKEEWTTPSS